MSKNELRQQRGSSAGAVLRMALAGLSGSATIFLYFVPHFPNFFGTFYLDFFILQ